MVSAPAHLGSSGAPSRSLVMKLPGGGFRGSRAPRPVLRIIGLLCEKSSFVAFYAHLLRGDIHRRWAAD